MVLKTHRIQCFVPIARPGEYCYFLRVKLQEIEHEALALTEGDRAKLVLSLVDTFIAPGMDISDQEACCRDAEMENGTVTPMAHEDFIRYVMERRHK